MKLKEIVQALRCRARYEKPTNEGCKKCPYWATENLEEWQKLCGWASCAVYQIISDAADAIERLTAENTALREKQRWIPVTERLPERDVQVLGWYKDNPFSQYRPEVVAWNGNGWVFVYAHRYVTNVTHWMPLPGAPEEGDHHEPKT